MSSMFLWLALAMPVVISDQLTVTVTPENQVPVVEAGPDETVPITAGWLSKASVVDDGLPNPPGRVTVQWVKVSGPGDVVFADPTAVLTTATFSVPGVYVLELRASDDVEYRPPPRP